MIVVTYFPDVDVQSATSVSKSNHFYLIRLYSEFESFYKLGVTYLQNGSPRRFKDYNKLGYQIEVLKLIEFKTYEECHDKEVKLKRLIRNYTYCPKNWPYNTSEECFKFEDIDFNKLPNQFVLKTTHDCGGVVVCKDKNNLDYNSVSNFLKRHLKQNYYYEGREWPYKNVRPRIIAEQYIKDNINSDLKDYKFFCFNGQVKALFVATDRNIKGKEVKFDFYDENFNHLSIKNGHENANEEIKKPQNFDKMKELAAVLSEGLPHLRVDFYEVNGKIFFGELTFFHFGGFVKFEPEEWDYKLGEWLQLPKMAEGI